MTAYGPVTNHLATSALIPCTTFQADFSSCVQGIQPQADAFYALSFPQVPAAHNLMQNKLLACAQVEPEIQDPGPAIVGGVSFLTGILAIAAAAAAGHRLNRKLSYEKQGAIRWTVSGLALFQQWLQEKLVAFCTLGLPDEDRAVEGIKREKPKEIFIPKPIRDAARLISLHKRIMKNGWQPYGDLFPSDKFKALMQFVNGEQFDDIPEIEVLRQPTIVMALRHEDGREKQIRLRHLKIFEEGINGDYFEYFQEIFDLQTSDEWYARWTESLDKPDLAELSVRITSGAGNIGEFMSEGISVSVEVGAPFIRLRYECDYIDFELAELDDLDEQRRLLKAYDTQLYVLRNNSLYKGLDMTRSCFASLMIWFLDSGFIDVDDDDLILSDDIVAVQSQQLMNQNPKFFDSVTWKNMPEQVKEAMIAWLEAD